MREAQEVAVLRFVFPAFLAIRGGEPPEFDEAGFIRVERQHEFN